jgi:hypothetical protein
LSELQRANKQLTEQLEHLQAQASQKPQEQAAPIPQITDADSQEFGPDMVEFVKRAVGSYTEPQIRDLQQKINELSSVRHDVERVVGDTQQMADDRFFSSLASLVPDFETINQDEAFLIWLQHPVSSLSDISRMALLQQARENLDFHKAALFFQEFKKQLNGEPQQSLTATPQPNQTTAAPPTQQVVPGRSRGQTPSTAATKQAKALTLDEFAARQRSGYYNGRWDDIERDRRIAAENDLNVA